MPVLALHELQWPGPERLVFGYAAFARDVGMLGSVVHVLHEDFAAAFTKVDLLNFYIEAVDFTEASGHRLAIIIDAFNLNQEITSAVGLGISHACHVLSRISNVRS